MDTDIRVIQHPIDRPRVAKTALNVRNLELSSSDSTLYSLEPLVLVLVAHLEVGDICRGVTTSVSQGISNRVEPGVELALKLGLERVQVDRLERTANIGSTSTTHKIDDVLSNNLSRVLNNLDLSQDKGLSITTVPHVWDKGRNGRSTLYYLDLSTADGLGSVNLDTHKVNSVQRCVRAGNSDRLIA